MLTRKRDLELEIDQTKLSEFLYQRIQETWGVEVISSLNPAQWLDDFSGEVRNHKGIQTR